MTKNKPLLIIVDYQNDYVHQSGKIAKRLKAKLNENRRILPAIQNLLHAWHRKQNPVLFILSDYNIKKYSGAYKKYRTTNAFGNTAIKGTWGHELYRIIPNRNDKIITKNFPHGFIKTNLEKYLTNIHPSTIYFTGINTDVCVFHTAFQTALLGYKVYIVKEATAASTKKNKKIFLEYLKKVTGVGIIKSKLILKEKYDR